MLMCHKQDGALVARTIRADGSGEGDWDSPIASESAVQGRCATRKVGGTWAIVTGFPAWGKR
jgi:hypothetical protein